MLEWDLAKSSRYVPAPLYLIRYSLERHTHYTDLKTQGRKIVVPELIAFVGGIIVMHSSHDAHGSSLRESE